MAKVFIHVTGNGYIKRTYNPCLVTLCKHLDLHKVVIDGGDHLKKDSPNGDIVVFCVSEMNWLCHYVANDRDSIFSAKPLVLSRKEFLESCILYGKLSFSQDDTKITAYFPREGMTALRISTDLEIIQHVIDQYRLKLHVPHGILWYQDPLPK